MIGRMPTTPRKRKEPRDVNELAFSIVNDLTGDEPPEPETEADPKAVERGKKGGASRASSLTGEKRSEIAKKAARERWGRQR
jgi:hypothetical protein